MLVCVFVCLFLCALSVCLCNFVMCVCLCVFEDLCQVKLIRLSSCEEKTNYHEEIAF